MGDRRQELWLTRRAPEAAVEAFLAFDAGQPLMKPDIDEAVAEAKNAGREPASISPCVVALTDGLSGVDEDTWGVLITQAARTFREAEACLTARLGKGQSVEIDEATWVPSGLPERVLEAASCTTSLVTAWALRENDWCVLEVDQEDSDRPIALTLYIVSGTV